MNLSKAKEILFLISISAIAYYISFYAMCINLINLTTRLYPKVSDSIPTQIILIFLPRSFVFLFASLFFVVIVKKDMYFTFIIPIFSIYYEIIFAIIYKINYFKFNKYMLLAQLIMLLCSFGLSYLGAILGIRLVGHHKEMGP